MTTNNISGATYTDMTNAVDNVSVSSASTETNEYFCNWSKWRGYYDAIPQLQSVIDRKALYTVGKGFKAKNAKTKITLERIRGMGKDTANTIFYNAVRVYTIGGDFFAEIIKNKRGEIINLKPLDPGIIKIVANKQGIIIRYEQFANGMGGTATGTFMPERIFHLAWNRLADAIHGNGTISKLVDIIESQKETMNDMRIVYHRYVKPLIISEIDSDDSNVIAAYKAKLDKAVALGENMIIPKDTVKQNLISIPQYSTLDPLPWLQWLTVHFTISEGVPSVVLGQGAETTEASAKILYIAFQQMVEWNQLYLEEQIEAQLGLEVEFTFPVNLVQDLQTDAKKDGQTNGPEKKSEVQP